MRYAPRSAALLLVTGLTGTPIAMPAAQAAAQQAAAATPVSLRLDLRPGATVEQAFSVDMQMQQEAQGMQTNVGMAMSMELTQEVEAVNGDGNFVTDLNVKRVRLETELPMYGKAVLDTEDPTSAEGTPLAAQIGPLLALTDSPLRRVISPRGEVLSTDQTEGGVNPTRQELLTMVRVIMPTFPDRPLNLGDTWDQTLASNLPGNAGGPIQSTLTWTLRSVEGGDASFGLSGTNRVQAQPNPGTDLRLEIRSEGSAVVDTRTGLVRTMTLTQNNAGDVTTNNGEVTMPMTSTTTIRLDASY